MNDVICDEEKLWWCNIQIWCPTEDVSTPSNIAVYTYLSITHFLLSFIWLNGCISIENSRPIIWLIPFLPWILSVVSFFWDGEKKEMEMAGTWARTPGQDGQEVHYHLFRRNDALLSCCYPPSFPLVSTR